MFYNCFLIIFPIILSVYLLDKEWQHFKYLKTKNTDLRRCSGHGFQESSTKTPKEKHRICWMDPPPLLLARADAMYSGFDNCAFSNCLLTFTESNALQCSAIIFNDELFLDQYQFKRPSHQTWIYFEKQPPIDKWHGKGVFNWTMTYKRHSDIHLPFGKIVKNIDSTERDFYEIAKSKNKTALIMSPSSKMPSHILAYILILKEYIDINITFYGGTFKCSDRFHQDICSETINQYKFFLAFQNSFCDEYFTENIFEVYDYDTVLITRGGLKHQIKEFLPEGTYISTDDFKNARHLGEFLKSMTLDDYANILKRKSEFKSESFASIFRNSMCKVCYRLNNKQYFQHTSQNGNVSEVISRNCIQADDLA